ncbi:nitroreductase [Mucidula mucida]|nr:nitroreductase [Mucidula mucida]
MFIVAIKSVIGPTDDTLMKAMSNNSIVVVADSLLKDRFSCRYFTSQPVSRETIEAIIDVARFAPSSSNIQPLLKVYCISGDLLEAVAADLVQAFNTTPPEEYSPDVEFYPKEGLPEPYLHRLHDFGQVYYGALNIARDDVEGRKAATARSFQLYDAPVTLIITIDRRLNLNSWLDVGYFMQSINVAARARGLETVTQQSTTLFPNVLRKHLLIGDEEIIALSMSLGYPDVQKVAQYYERPKRRDVSEIVYFLGNGM